MGIRDSLGKLWQNITKPLAKPVNTIGNDALSHVFRRVTKETDMSVYAQDYTMGNGLAVAGVKKNAGILAPADASAEDVTEARKVFQKAAREAGKVMTIDEVCVYEAPSTSLVKPKLILP